MCHSLDEAGAQARRQTIFPNFAAFLRCELRRWTVVRDLKPSAKLRIARVNVFFGLFGHSKIDRRAAFLINILRLYMLCYLSKSNSVLGGGGGGGSIGRIFF